MKIGKKYGYVRVSSKSQESNSSIKSQKEQLIQNGIEIKNIHSVPYKGHRSIQNKVL